MTKLEEFHVKRVMSSEEATNVVGESVPDLQPDVNEPGIYRDADTGEAVFMYVPFEGSVTKLRRAVLGAGMSTILRSGGSRYNSRSFGFTNRNVILKRESCSPTSLAWDEPEAQMILNETADVLGRQLREALPEIHEQDSTKMDAVLPEWRMTENTLWTTGNINQSSALPYHRDGANFDTWTGMPVVRRGMDGGHLHIPEYNVTLNCRDGWALYFNGHFLVHGVTPMKSRTKDGYRYSIVFYAKRGMKDCHTYAVEVGEARAKRKDRELAGLNLTIADATNRGGTDRRW